MTVPVRHKSGWRLFVHPAFGITFDALVASPGAFSCPGELRPTWFDCCHLVALNPVPGTSVQPEFLLVARSPDEPLYAVLHPGIEALRPHVMDTLVRATGHYDDPAARDCVYTSYPDPGPPPADEVVDMAGTAAACAAAVPRPSAFRPAGAGSAP